jgi:hypothetical protein
VSHAGVTLVRAVSDATGLTDGLSRALATRRLVVHDRGRVLADLACAIADGGEWLLDPAAPVEQRQLSHVTISRRIGGFPSRVFR